MQLNSRLQLVPKYTILQELTSFILYAFLWWCVLYQCTLIIHNIILLKIVSEYKIFSASSHSAMKVSEQLPFLPRLRNILRLRKDVL